jgi:hypothetical protein
MTLVVSTTSTDCPEFSVDSSELSLLLLHQLLSEKELLSNTMPSLL